ncbi:MAG: glycosyltransferase family 2 protein [Nitrospiraceae bacterium]|nr:glycosyltransferase family 2 protein [Nitrospiraceae bacterium]
MLKVSIITITFNSKRYLEQTIQSVLDQDYPDIEYIIVDGGSTDGTLDIIRKYENRISTWISEPDKGIADAMNKGIKMASGNIIGIIHADDFYEPEAIKAVAEIFSKDPSIGLVHGDLRFWNPGETASAIDKPPATEKTAWKRMPAWHPTVFVRRGIYEKFGLFDISYKIAMDHELLLRFLKAGVRFFYSGLVLANMRTTGVSNIRYHDALMESKKVATKHGTGKIKIFLYYTFYPFFKEMEKATGRSIKKHGLSGIANLYRKIFYPHVPTDY